MLCDMLVDSGASCSAASGGQEALGYFDRSKFDLVLLDHTMSGMTWLKTLRHIQDRIPGQPAVMLTVVSDLDSVVKAMKLGALDYILKPIAVEALLSRLSDAMTRGVAAREARDQAGRLACALQDQERVLEQRAREIQALNRLVQHFIGNAGPETSTPSQGGPSSRRLSSGRPHPLFARLVSFGLSASGPSSLR